MRKTPKKLSLSRERLKRLDGALLAEVCGGSLVTVDDPITRTELTYTGRCLLKG